MNDRHFDELTKVLGRSASRRVVFKLAIASALSGLFLRGKRDTTDAARFRPACARVGQNCSTSADGLRCCSGLTCPSDTQVCCAPLDVACLADSDCCSGTVCRPARAGAFLTAHCQAPGQTGELCQDAADCASGLACVGGVCCESAGQSCASQDDCCDGLFCVNLGNGLTCSALAPPDAMDDTYSAARDTVLSIPAPGVLANDAGQLITAVPASGATPQGGSYVLNADGSFTYTPPTGFASPPNDTFTYTATNAAGNDTATATITVFAPPSAVDDAYDIAQNTARTIAAPGVLANDAVNGAVISASTNPAHGALTLNADGGFTYTPDTDYAGPDSFTYTLSNVAGSSTATVDLTVFAAPVAVDDAYDVAQNTARAIAAPGVLGNDTVNGATIIAHTDPAHGSLTLNADGGFTYAPDTDYVGPDSFAYTIANIAGSSTATVDLTVFAPPSAVDDSYDVAQNTARTVSAPGVLGNDTVNGATIMGHTDPSHGTLTLNADGSFTYTPNADYTGPDAFDYTLTNFAGSSAATVTLTVLAAPSAVDDAYDVPEDTALSVGAPGVLGNDTVNGASITANTDPANGTVILSADGGFTYTPNSGFTGTDTWDYTIANFAGSSTATVTMTVAAAPTAVDDAYEVALDMARVVSAPGVLGNDTVNGATITGHTDPSHGTLTLGADGSFTYTPESGYTGPDAFDYTLTNVAGSATATVSLTVVAPPTAVNDAYQTPPDTTLSVSASGVLSNDTLNGATISGNTDPSHGSVTLGADGSFTYTPDSGFQGADTFTYTLENFAGSSTATVTINVGGPPVATGDAFDVTGNVKIDSSQIPASVLSNDTLNGATISAFDATSVNGGQVTLDTSNGQFTYNPPAGFTGTDTFTYTLTNAIGSSVGTVTLTVADTVWFIDNTAPAGGDGRVTAPFNSIAAYNASTTTKDAGDIIFFYAGSGSYDGNLTLLDSQQVIGQSIDLTTVVTFADGSVGVPATGASPTLTASSGDSITLATDNTVEGIIFGATAGFGLAGTTVGSLTINSVSKNGAGGAIKIATSGTLDATFASITSTNASGEAIKLVNVGGTFVVSGATSITNPTTNGIAISNSSATATFAATTVNGSVSDAVTLQTNTGATSFTSLDSAPNVNARALNVSGGTLTISSGTLSTSGAAAVTIANAALNVTLTAVSTSGGANGLSLTSTTGSFQITGSGTTRGSGGVIQNTTGDGVVLNSAAGVTLKNLTIQNGSTDGVDLTSVTGLSLINCLITGNNDNGIHGATVTDLSIADTDITNNTDAANEAGIWITQLLGTCAWTNTKVTDATENIVAIQNSSGTLTKLTISGGEIANNVASMFGANGLWIEATNTAVMTVDVETCSIHDIWTDGVFGDASGTASLTLTVNDSTFDNFGLGIDVAASGAGVIKHTLTNNTLTNPFVNSINVFSSSTSNVQGTVSGNTITGGGAGSSGTGINLSQNDTSTLYANVHDNVIDQIGVDQGIWADAAGTGGNMSAVIQNNTVTTVAIDSFAAIYVNGHNATPLCATLTGNTSTAANGVGIFARQAGTATVTISGLATGAHTAAEVATYLDSVNSGAPSSATGTFQGGASCPLPS